MIVVSDTSPVNYLVLIGEVEVLPQLFNRVLIPETVCRELLHPRAPEPVRGWAASPPAWLEVQAPQQVDQTIRLHPGERDAICLALEVGADTLLVDERPAARVGSERGLSVTGTLGVLAEAGVRNLTDFPRAVEALRRTTFRFSEETLRAVVQRYHELRGERRPERDRGRER